MGLRTVLVANRGEIARRVIATCHRMGLEAVAVYSEADRDLPHVREADRAVCIGPPSPGASYLDVESILAAARRAGADAVHPGYGFLSENARFAEAVREAGLTWIGPPPDAIRRMGDKAAARALATELGIPVVPGYDGRDQGDAAFAAAAERIGYPVLVKAAAGGGGRGMRRVARAAELAEALAAARREAAAAFGDGTLLLERYLARPRHIEVQVLADRHGNAVHLFERECSIQRRHQKIVEEAPSPAVDAARREELGRAAVTLARAVGYEGAGTVEFLLDEQGRHHFLEMNTRLQVEHPVTEAITGLDLVWLQIAVARGEKLPFAQAELAFSGHAIEARVYAEDPLRDYLPSSGTLWRFDLPGGDGIRIDAGYAHGNVVGTHYDPLLAKVIAWGPDRATATARLGRVLTRAWIPGVTTNLPLLRQVIAHPAWSAGDLDTHFLERHGLPAPPPLNLERGALAATVLGYRLRREAWPATLPLGWRLEGPAVSSDRWHSLDRECETTWRVLGPDRLEVRVGEATHDVRVLEREGDWLRVEVDGETHAWRVAWRDARGAESRALLADGDVVYVHLGDGEAVVGLVPRFPAPRLSVEEPGACAAPMPGRVAQIRVRVGEAVSKGQPLLVLEAMKMEHALLAPEEGIVAAVLVEEGEQVVEGQVLVRLEAGGESEPGLRPLDEKAPQEGWR